MSAPKSPRWTAAETAALRETYPAGGLKAAQEALPHRSWASIYVKANKLGLHADQKLTNGGRRCSLVGDHLTQALSLREQGWSFARIGAYLGYAECTVSNAVIIERCKSEGYTPAEREPGGRLTPAAMDRLRWMLKKGLKGVEIQLRMGVSASCVAEQRRRYNADLATRGKALLPPPGNGERYSGVRVSKEAKREAEALFLKGYGTLKVAEASGVSKTVCTRIRRALIIKLRRRGECLPGCDIDGKRRVMLDHALHIPETLRLKFRSLILERVPVKRAAAMTAIGLCSAYKLRDELRTEMGDDFPKARMPGRMSALQLEMLHAQIIPVGQEQRYRQLVRQCGDADAARRLLRQEIADAKSKMSFEEKLALVANGAPISARLDLTKAAHTMTLGGVSVYGL